MTSIKELCEKAQILDLSDLGNKDLPLEKRLTLIWEVLKVKLTSDQQTALFRFFGKHCKNDKVKPLFDFVDKMLSVSASPAMDIMLRDNFVVQLMGIPEVVVNFGGTLGVFCAFPAQKLPDVATLINHSDPGILVTAIFAVFPDETKDSQDFLVRPQFEADKDKFMDAHDQDVTKFAESHEKRMLTLNTVIEKLNSVIEKETKLVADLQLQLPALHSKRPAAGSSDSSGGKRSKA
jgi:hypothetical protein